MLLATVVLLSVGLSLAQYNGIHVFQDPDVHPQNSRNKVKNDHQYETISNTKDDTPVTTRYTPDWPSLDSRPLPEWYDRAKFGIFLHWGVYSVPSLISEWFWYYWKGDTSDSNEHKQAVAYMQANYPPNFQYADFASQFHAELYDPDFWASIFQASRAKYVVLTSKHHEGFTMWPSKYSFNWNAMDVGPNRDLLGDLAKAVRARGMRMGFYHSLLEWFNPLILADGQGGYQNQSFVNAKSWPCLMELVNTYKPDVLWSDGDWVAPDSYWRSREFLAWLYSDSPVKDTIVTNDRWGSNDISCKHGDFWTCSDRFSPGHLLPHKWESCMTMDQKSWGFRRTMSLDQVLSPFDLVSTLSSIVAYGGNLLLNVGPTSDGRIVPIFEERLRGIGCWLDLNGDSIFDTVPWRYQNDTHTPNIWYTKSGNYSGQPQPSVVYAIILDWPSDSNSIMLAAPRANPNSKAFLLAGRAPAPGIPLTLQPVDHGILIQASDSLLSQIALKRGQWSCEVALVVKLVGLTNL